MKRNLHITLTVLSGISLTGLLAGCTIPTTKEDIVKSATEYNLVAEQAGNEMLLLNIVRASKRRPMYFTSFGKLTRNMSFEVGTGSIQVPFDRTKDGSISPTIAYTNSPFFDLGVLDTQEFTNGIMTPVPMKTIEYYWSQGWHKEILLHLFIRRIDIIDPDDPNDPNDPNYLKPKKTYRNYPGNQKEFEKFQKYIQDKNWEWGIEPEDAKSVGEVNAADASQLQNLIKVQKAGLKLMEVKQDNKVQGKEKDEDQKMKLCLSQVNYAFTRKPSETYRKELEERIKEIEEQGGDASSLRKLLKPQTVKVGDSGSDERKEELKIKAYLRSPEAILYYLGEILRVEHRPQEPYTPMIYAGFEECGECPARLFYARVKRTEGKDPCVSVDYEGSKYIIPRVPDSDKGCCTDRSMHVLSLVSLLIGQQKKSTEVPTTATVSVIGR